jgi:hypothetical protein
MRLHLFARATTALAAGLAAGFTGATSPAGAQTHVCPVVVSSTVPADECGGAFANGQINAANFVWNAFIALNWPALAGKRDTPDAGQNFGADVSPTVWETFRAKVEIYPGNGNRTTGPHGATIDQQPPYNATNPPDFGYDEAPKYVYSPFNVGSSDGQVAACANQNAPANAAWIPLDETTQIQINQTFAGVGPDKDPNGYNSAPQLIRYMVKMNRTLYDTIVANQFWYKGPPLNTAMTNFQTALRAGQTKNPTPPFVQFPAGSKGQPNTIEVKAAWRPLTDTEFNSHHFHTATVRYYEMNGNTPCYREDDRWGLVGLHIIQRTPSAPWLIWATFEQADNILDENNNKVEDADGNNVSPQPRPTPTTPALQSNPASPSPAVTFVNPSDPYCTSPGTRLYFRENPSDSGLPSAGNICVNQRWHPIPPDIIKVNAQAHAAIKTYLGQHGMSDSPWLYYKLVNVQPVPFDKSEIRAGGGATDPSVYYTANAVIETDYTLGMYSGRIASTGAPSDVNPDNTPFANTRLLPFQGEPLFKKPLNMGGCTGCHANSALKGTEFSFSLQQSSVRTPEPPNPFVGARPLLRDKALFAPVQ